ncbi:MAG: VacJ family lipoprotein, partial [Rhodospirillales bacterium]|nr:VacJ family lipoprotein [Rhodospirillales bacterium]
MASAADEVELAQAARVEDTANDPIEPINRFFFGVNQIIEQTVLGMAASLYNAFVPPPV